MSSTESLRERLPITSALHRRARCAAVGAAVVLIAACGSTVPQAAREAASGSLDPLEPPSGFGATNEQGPEALGDQPVDQPVDGTTGTSLDGGVGPSTSEAASGSGGAAGVPPKGRGWDEENVYIGLMISLDDKAAMGAIGASGDPGDPQAQANAVTKYFNDRGGLFGRKVIVRFSSHSTAAKLSQPEVEAQTACTRFTQDQPVVAVINPETLIDTANFRDCLTKAGVLLASVAITSYDDSQLREGRGLYFPLTMPSWNKFAPALVNSLSAQQYFSGWNTSSGGPGSAPVRVGIFMKDDEGTNRAYALLRAALAAEGHEPVVVYKYRNFASEAGNAVLQMRSANVTHVLGFDPWLFTFAAAAESQVYRPRYGLHTGNAPVAAFQGNAPAEQQVGAAGLGHVPAVDTSGQRGEITPGGPLCRQVMAASSIAFDGNRQAEANAFAICDAIRLIVGAAEASGSLSASSIATGIGRIGPEFNPAGTFSSALSDRSPVLPGSGRDFGYDTSCSCFAYTSSSPRSY
jgi:hypothetical protein